MYSKIYEQNQTKERIAVNNYIVFLDRVKFCSHLKRTVLLISRLFVVRCLLWLFFLHRVYRGYYRVIYRVTDTSLLIYEICIISRKRNMKENPFFARLLVFKRGNP